MKKSTVIIILIIGILIISMCNFDEVKELKVVLPSQKEQYNQN